MKTQTRSFEPRLRDVVVSAHHAAGDAGRTDFPGLRDPSRARRGADHAVRDRARRQPSDAPALISARPSRPSSPSARAALHAAPTRIASNTADHVAQRPLRGRTVLTRELGQEFAQANPKLAGFLARKPTDPDVERLLEGFAFSVARLRQKLDDEMPEFATALSGHLAAIPATAAPMSIVAFAVDGGRRGRRPVPLGTALA